MQKRAHDRFALCIPTMLGEKVRISENYLFLYILQVCISNNGWSDVAKLEQVNFVLFFKR